MTMIIDLFQRWCGRGERVAAAADAVSTVVRWPGVRLGRGLGVLAWVLLLGMDVRGQVPVQWQAMEFGPTFSSSFDVRTGAARNPVYKGVAIRLGDAGNATALFDTDLLRYAAWWDGGFIRLPEKSRDGLGDGVAAFPAGTVRMGSPVLAGVGSGGAFADPRPQPWGPLPREQAKYRGLYQFGARVVIAYTAGQVQVLDSPWSESVEGDTGRFEVFTRTLEIDPNTGGVPLLVAGRSTNAVAVAAGEGIEAWADGERVTAVAVAPSGRNVARLGVVDGQMAVVIRESGEVQRVKLLLWSGSKEQLGAFVKAVAGAGEPVGLAAWTRGGERRWGEPQVTRGVVGTEPGAYAVDTLTAPYGNPWKSYLRFSGHDFFSNGDAAVCSVSGDVWRVAGIDAGLERLVWTRVATGLHEPLGLKIVRDEVYVLCRGQIVRLKDLNGDGEADFYENFNNDAHFFGHGHAFYTELHTDAKGDFYFTTCADPDDRPGIHGGSLLRVSADGQRLDRIATGFRNPNGMTVGSDGRVTVADQQGTWVPSSRIDWVRPGGFYGYVPMHHREVVPTTYDKPILWLPHSVDNSSGGQAWIEDDRWGPFKGRLAHLSYGACRLFIVFPEMVGDQVQGAAVALPVKFGTGVMRARFNPRDGQLYVSGLRGWQTAGTLSGAFYRVRYTRRPVGLPLSFRVVGEGVLIEFPTTLDPKVAGDPESYAVSQWNYRWTKDYGSASYSVADPEKKGTDPVKVVAAELLPGGRSVLLKLESLKPVMQMRVTYSVAGLDGTPLSGEIHNTINVVPGPPVPKRNLVEE